MRASPRKSWSGSEPGSGGFIVKAGPPHPPSGHPLPTGEGKGKGRSGGRARALPEDCRESWLAIARKPSEDHRAHTSGGRIVYTWMVERPAVRPQMAGRGA